MPATRSQWSTRKDRSDRRNILREATAPVSKRARNAPTTGRMKQAVGSTYTCLSPGPSSVHSSQHYRSEARSTTATPDDSPTTDIHWLEVEVERLLLLVGDRLDLGTVHVNEISLHFLNKVNRAFVPSALELKNFQTRAQIRDGHRVLEKKDLLPIRPPISALDLKLGMAALRNSFRSKPGPEERAVGQPLTCARWRKDDGLFDADAEGETDDDEIDHGT
ncbi:hypothetical protein B0H14DRAFT_2591308 [Mycena olivaceomarginata]|nr:hypothetical protein B0H14DRAFT_2591308 [Mycena olivaceomarginata]